MYKTPKIQKKIEAYNQVSEFDAQTRNLTDVKEHLKLSQNLLNNTNLEN